MDKENTLIMPLIALRGMVMYPKMILHFDIGREKSVKALEQALKDGNRVFLVAQKDVKVNEPDRDGLYNIGVCASVRQTLKISGDNIRVLVEGEYRARIEDIIEYEPYIKAKIERIDEKHTDSESVKSEALLRSIQAVFQGYAELSPRMNPETILTVMECDDLGYLCDYVAQSVMLKLKDRQRILELQSISARATALLTILNREYEVLKLELEIMNNAKEKIEKNQREYYLREQLRAIKEELGEGTGHGFQGVDEEEDEIGAYYDKLKKLSLDKETHEKLFKEIRKLERTPSHAPDYTVLRNYLDLVLELPWNKYTKERTDLKAAERVLEADHYGLEKVKERILEFLAVRKTLADAGEKKFSGQVLCLVGPPGVGKTSIGVSIAKAMNRKYARLSLGGVRDEADIRGHRKTYVGAMPGRIITAIKQAGSSNALILLDEIDKLGNDFRGDPASALLEVLDTAQSHEFRDHYIEVPFDLSQVMFVVTANTTSTIPRPLLDRMDVIEIGSYTDEEKLHIAKDHLIPKQLKKHGLRKTNLRFTDDGIRTVIDLYTRESGVRTLEREIATACRRTAKMITDEPEKTRHTVNNTNYETFLGAPKFKRDKAAKLDEIGIVNGLAWTSVGGELLEVEVNVVDGSGKLELTGNLGDVMKESTKIALSYIRSRAKMFGIDPDFYKKYDLHIHFPEGAVPKDGPSAGITVATALISALSNTPVRHDVAMTGEITLRGRVLPIGGLKEKTMAAYRAGMKTVIIPSDNETDLAEIDQDVRAALTFIPVAHMDAVVEAALTKKQVKLNVEDCIHADIHEDAVIAPQESGEAHQEVNTIRH